MKQLTENWVNFRRVECKEGFIDKWVGDAADNPNNENKSRIALNSFSNYYRLNGKGEWIEGFMFIPMIQKLLILYPLDYSANEIWENTKIEEPAQ